MGKTLVQRTCIKGPLCLCYGTCCPVDKPKTHCAEHDHQCHYGCGKA